MDGLVALLLMCQWADSLGLTYSYYVNSNRYHGFELNLADLKGYLIIASDFTITEDEVKAIFYKYIINFST
jgi:single-stranded DNA-specific DHH superfamily exonuclease